MMVLGVSALYHDAAAAIVVDGRPVCAAQEERFTRKKHDPRLPVNAIRFCLENAKVKPDRLDAVVFYENPLLSLDRILATAPHEVNGLSNTTLDRIETIFANKLWVADQIRKSFGRLGKNDRLLAVEHHVSHAASAFYPSPFDSAAILTLDAVGEWTTSMIGEGLDVNIDIREEIEYPHSLGLLYSAFTAYCGFRVNSGEYKLMGLAPYGTPIFFDMIMDNLLDLRPDGSFCLNLEYFDYIKNDRMINSKFECLFGAPSRAPESELTGHYMDVAASIQKVTEEVLRRLCHYTTNITEQRNLVLAGGVALNCVANSLIKREEIFSNIWIQPAAGDAGGALGAALYVTHKHLGVQRRRALKDNQAGSFLGPGFSNENVEQVLGDYGVIYTRYDDRSVRDDIIAEYLSKGLVVGVLQGRMEFGPRALGHRSILGDPRNEEMQSRLNLKIKFRESFRPFAPSVLLEDVAEYFDFNDESPYMLLVGDVRKDRQRPFDITGLRQNWSIRDAVNTPRSDIPAITHVDYSARLHTVDADRNPDFYNLLKKFKDKTGCSVLVNTSFNVRGEPIVCTPEDALHCFLATDMDVVVMEDCVALKDDQPLGLLSERKEISYELD